jgi:hypothetical protein
MRKLLLGFLFLYSVSVSAQVKIGDNPGTINSNSILELESTNKGFLPPRIALNSTVSIAPLTGTVPSGMLVYSSGGSLADGYYYWNGTSWRLIATSELNAVAKTASTTLTKTETFVLASNDITLRLPAITASDNGLAITVKNIGSHADLVVVKGTGVSVIDGKDSSALTRWYGKTYVAYNGNWVHKEKEVTSTNLLDVSNTGSWTTVDEVLEFLDKHMSGPTVVRLSGDFSIETTQVVDLSYPITFQGLSYGKASLIAESALSGSPMFRCLSESYFKMLTFDGSAYGAVSGENAIQFETAGEYYEIKDCNFTGFNKTIVAKSNVEFWLFETDINDATVAGVEIAAGATNGVTFKASETDFINCAKGINLVSGNAAVVSILNCGFYNTTGQTGVSYVPATFTAFSSMFIQNNSWNNTGTFLSGFDFSRTDGRDSKAFIQNNAGDGDKKPSCHINVLNNSTSTSIPLASVWYKANWNSSSTNVTTTLWTVANSSGNVNKITYQPSNRRGGYFIISGNLTVNQSNRTISLGIVKNGASGVRYGETTIRTGGSGTSSLFSTIIYLSDIAPNDYFEIYCSSAGISDVVTFQDVQWYADTK